jgi:hypothetical protein
LEELEGWVKDLVFSRTHDIKFFRISETYWITEALITHDLEKKGE